MRRLLRSDAGQATLEYGAVLALVLVLLVAGGTAVAAPGIANGVGRGVQRALCDVAGGADCHAQERTACTVRSTQTGGSVTAKLAFVRLGRGLGLLRAEQSDGSMDLTLLEHLEGGVEASLGAEGHLRLGRTELGGGGLLTAQAVASLGGGRSWHVSGKPAADALERRLVEVLAGKGAAALPVVGGPLAAAQQALGVGAGRELPPADAVTTRGGVRGSAHGELAGVLDLEAAVGATVGRREERVTGRRTWYLEVEHGGALALTSGLARLGADAQASLALTMARDGTPLELSVTAVGSMAGALELPGALGRGATAGEHGARSVEVAAALDLAQPDDLAAARRLLRALRPGSAAADAPAALGDLSARLAAHGRVEVRRYGVDRTESRCRRSGRPRGGGRGGRRADPRDVPPARRLDPPGRRSVGATRGLHDSDMTRAERSSCRVGDMTRAEPSSCRVRGMTRAEPSSCRVRGMTRAEPSSCRVRGMTRAEPSSCRVRTRPRGSFARLGAGQACVYVCTTCEHVFVPYVELHCHSAFSFLDGARCPTSSSPRRSSGGTRRSR